ncbi:MAG: DNA polymerase III subunit delta [Flavobacteriales bacterium]|nr:DNA polymerase III subunit delta [Flavobacteriales bacterium]
MAMTFDALIKDIHNGKLSPIYLLHGDEPYFVDRVSETLVEKVLSPEEKEFNQSILYGKDTDVKDLISTAKRFPMMSKYHLVVLREAQDLKKVEELEPLLQQPVQSTILVLAFKKKVDQRKKWVKSAAKNGVVFNSARIPEWKLGDWVKKEATRRKLDLDMKSASMLIEYLGDDLQRISKDLDKLHMLCKDGLSVTPNMIQKVIGVSRDYNIFELQDALLTKNVYKAQKIVKYFSADPRSHPIQPLIGALYGMYSRMIILHAKRSFNPDTAAAVLKAKPFYAKKILAGAKRYSYGSLVRNISILRQYDMKSKGVGSTGNTSNGELMREMVFKLIH